MTKRALPQYIKLSDNLDPMEFTFLSPVLLLIFADFNLWSQQRGLPVRLTNIINERIDNVSVSDTHSQGRALDVSVIGWTKEEIKEAVESFNKKYKSYGTSADGKNPMVFVYHYVTGWHFHIQIKKDSIKKTTSSMIATTNKGKNNGN